MKLFIFYVTEIAEKLVDEILGVRNHPVVS